MSVNLNRSDLIKLVAIVQRLPGFDNERDRRRLLILTLGLTPSVESLLHLIDLSGAPMLAATAWLTHLAYYGQLEYGKEALGIFLNAVIPIVDKPTSDYIRSLFQQYQLDSPVVPQPVIGVWRGRDDLPINEIVIGENTLFHVYQLNLALQAAKAVVHIELETGATATGFMVAPDLLMTNHHVIISEQEAISATYSFDYELLVDRTVSPTRKARGKKAGHFVCCKALDYAIVQLDNVPDYGSPLKLTRHSLSSDESVTVIGHPNGHLKRISLRNNAVAYFDCTSVQYTTSTQPGSSGSPVFGNNLFDVVALHHGTVPINDPTSKIPSYRNEGTAIPGLIDDLKSRSPEVHRILELHADGH